MKRLLPLLAALPLFGCGDFNKAAAGLSGYSKVCVDGVVYLQFPSGATVQVDPAGRPVGCR